MGAGMPGDHRTGVPKGAGTTPAGFARLPGRAVRPVLWLALAAVPALAQSAPGTISQSPLFLQGGVQSNVMLLLDDSGSMDWEVLTRSTGSGTQGSGTYYLNFMPATDDEKLALCPGYNVLMYDPTRVYTPWAGVDGDDRPYQDADVRAARENPFLGPGGACSVNLGFMGSNDGVCNLVTGLGPHGAYYYPWDDADGDGFYDPGECDISDGARVWVKDMTPAGQRNFANWFSYYRKREYVMKRALSEIISESRERVGLATINRNSPAGDAGVGAEVADIDDIASPVDAQARENKERLMRNLFRIDSHGGTPLRSGLDNVGRYFESGDSALFGFPVQGSPILGEGEGGECQQNFVVALSDGYWNGIYAGVGNADADGSSLFDGQSYADGVSDTLADIAMHYYERDLAPGLGDRVPVTNILPAGSKDENTAQHLVTFTVAFGLSGEAACDPADRVTPVERQGWPEICADPGYAGAGGGWPDPMANPAARVDDMRHAAWNGRGRFLSADDPQALIDWLQSAVANISARTATAASAVGLNSTNMQGGGLVYQAGFDSGLWSGELAAYAVLPSGERSLVWAAHEILDSRDLDADPRVMITYNGERGVPFRFPENYPGLGPNDLAPDQVADLLFNAPAGLDAAGKEAFGKRLVDYFHGASAGEGTAPADFRQRLGRRLPDIIHAAPVFVGSPDPGLYPDGIEGGGRNSYHTWANVTALGRSPMLYVGTNGGGLHGFDAETGKEVFVYLPKAVFSDKDRAGLHWLAEQGYEHRYYVDETPAVAEVFVNDKWRTFLVGGLGGGGKALYALDVSDPSSFDRPDRAVRNVLWEFTHPQLGFTFGRPTLAKLNNGKWAAIFGNGYNNDPDGDGRARLFMVDLATGGLIRSMPVGPGRMENGDCGDAASRCNGLSTPAVIDLNGDGIADRAYAGDLEGNLWAFDLTGSSASRWGVAFGGAPLFTATDGHVPGTRQPVTTQPAVSLHPTERGLDTAPNLMVFFGTGQYLAEGDAAAEGTQSFYGVWDSGAAIAGGRNDLVQQTVQETSTIIGGVDYTLRTLSDNPVDYSSKKGWFVDLPTPKERVIVNPLLFGEMVIFTTIIPDPRLCGSAGGGWLMALDSDNGGRPGFTAFDINDDGVRDEQDMIAGEPVSGIKSEEFLWQPGIVESGPGALGTILLPRDDSSVSGSRLDTRDIVGAPGISARSSWTRFGF